VDPVPFFKLQACAPHAIGERKDEERERQMRQMGFGACAPHEADEWFCFIVRG
jgi:hypothetical protein